MFTGLLQNNDAQTTIFVFSAYFSSEFGLSEIRQKGKEYTTMFASTDLSFLKLRLGAFGLAKFHQIHQSLTRNPEGRENSQMSALVETETIRRALLTS